MKYTAKKALFVCALLSLFSSVVLYARYPVRTPFNMFRNPTNQYNGWKVVGTPYIRESETDYYPPGDHNSGFDITEADSGVLGMWSYGASESNVFDNNHSVSYFYKMAEPRKAVYFKIVDYGVEDWTNVGQLFPGEIYFGLGILRVTNTALSPARTKQGAPSAWINLGNEHKNDAVSRTKITNEYEVRLSYFERYGGEDKNSYDSFIHTNALSNVVSQRYPRSGEIRVYLTNTFSRTFPYDLWFKVEHIPPNVDCYISTNDGIDWLLAGSFPFGTHSENSLEHPDTGQICYALRMHSCYPDLYVWTKISNLTMESVGLVNTIGFTNYQHFSGKTELAVEYAPTNEDVRITVYSNSVIARVDADNGSYLETNKVIMYVWTNRAGSSNAGTNYMSLDVTGVIEGLTNIITYEVVRGNPPIGSEYKFTRIFERYFIVDNTPDPYGICLNMDNGAYIGGSFIFSTNLVFLVTNVDSIEISFSNKTTGEVSYAPSRRIGWNARTHEQQWLFGTNGEGSHDIRVDFYNKEGEKHSQLIADITINNFTPSKINLVGALRQGDIYLAYKTFSKSFTLNVTNATNIVVEIPGFQEKTDSSGNKLPFTNWLYPNSTALTTNIMSISVTRFEEGTYPFTVKAYTVIGEETVSNYILVIDNYPDPILSILYPAERTLVSSNIFALSAVVDYVEVDNAKITNLSYYIDNNFVGNLMAPPFAYLYETPASFSLGEHVIKVEVRDSLGQVTSDTNVFYRGVARDDITNLLPRIVGLQEQKATFGQAFELYSSIYLSQITTNFDGGISTEQVDRKLVGLMLSNVYRYKILTSDLGIETFDGTEKNFRIKVGLDDAIEGLYHVYLYDSYSNIVRLDERFNVTITNSPMNAFSTLAKPMYRAYEGDFEFTLNNPLMADTPVRAYILDMGGRFVVELYNDIVPYHELHLTWNYRDQSDTFVTQGMYLLIVDRGEGMKSIKPFMIVR